MKKYMILFMLGLICISSWGQLKINPGAYWVNSGAAVVVLNDMDIVNDGTIDAGESIFRFTGGAGNQIGGSGATVFHEMDLAKTGNNKVTLLNSIDVGKRVIFTSGLLDLNQHDLTLAENAYLYNESESSRVTGPLGGDVIIRVIMDAPVGSNPGNLGAVITSTSNLGIVLIRRGHKSQSGTGMASSIQRYYDIAPGNNTALNATLRYYYFDAELVNESENLLKMYRSTNAGASWTDQNFGVRNAAQNFVENTGINAFSRWALSSSGGALPITGLAFYAKRTSNNTVQLNWNTKQEFNNKGFGIERKKENETDFTTVGFVHSLAAGGYSGNPLNYSKKDANDFTGTTYYRLKQEDLDGKFIYSVIRFVTGKEENVAGLKVWPIPSVGDINVLIQGIQQDVLEVFDMSGRLMRQMPVQNNTQQKISGLIKGSYIIRLADQHELVQKIIIQ